MLVLPMIAKDNGKSKIYQIELKLKDVYLDEVDKLSNESDIIVNGQSFLDSTYNTSNPSNTNTIDFIRNTSFYRQFYSVSTRKNGDGEIKKYKVMVPPAKVDDGSDSLYNSAILDLRKEIPGNQKGRIISLRKLGVGDSITDEKLLVVRKKMDSKKVNINESIESPDMKKMYETLKFLENFECTIVDNATIDVDTYKEVVEPFCIVDTKQSRELKSFYQVARDNTNVYAKLNYLSQILNGEGLDWIKSNKEKIKNKSRDAKYDK